MDLTADDRELIHTGFWAALRVVKLERPGAMAAAEAFLDAALAGEREKLLSLARTSIDEEREQQG